MRSPSRQRHELVTLPILQGMLLTIVLIVGHVVGVPGPMLRLGALVIPPVHMFAQLRGAYELRKRAAAWRTVALLAFAFTVLLAFIVLRLLHGLTD